MHDVFNYSHKPKLTEQPPRKLSQPRTILQLALVAEVKCIFFKIPLNDLKKLNGVYYGNDAPYFIIQCTDYLYGYGRYVQRTITIGNLESAVTYNSLIPLINNHNFKSFIFENSDQPVYIVKTFLMQLPKSLLSADIYTFINARKTLPETLFIINYWVDVMVMRLDAPEYKLAEHLLKCFQVVKNIVNVDIGHIIWPWFIRLDGLDKENVTTAAHMAKAQSEGSKIPLKHNADENMTTWFNHLLQNASSIFTSAQSQRNRGIDLLL